MSRFSEIINSPRGRPVAMVLGIIGLLGAVYFIWNSLGPSDAAASSTDRIFICSETGKTFRHTISIGETMPVKSPHSGKNTGYEPELCYWTADGQPKPDPTYVLLNDAVGKSGPTFCPDCKRLVVGLNPPAAPGMKPPPKESEYSSRGNR